MIPYLMAIPYRQPVYCTAHRDVNKVCVCVYYCQPTICMPQQFRTLLNYILLRYYYGSYRTYYGYTTLHFILKKIQRRTRERKNKQKRRNRARTRNLCVVFETRVSRCCCCCCYYSSSSPTLKNAKNKRIPTTTIPITK